MVSVIRVFERTILDNAMWLQNGLYDTDFLAYYSRYEMWLQNGLYNTDLWAYYSR